MNQKKAVVSTILAVLEERGVKYELGGSVAVSTVLTDDDKTKIRNTLFSMFRANQIEMKPDAKAKSADDAYLKNYVSGLLNNWVRKEPEFNCGNKYQAKNPGSRAGSGDSQIREMKKLLTQVTSEKDRQMIQEAIAARQLEIKPVETGIDFDKIPESLKSKLGIK